MSIVATAGSTFTYYLPGLEDQANPGLFKSSPTIAAGDFTISTNGGAFEAMDNTPTVKPTGGKQIEFILSAAETTAAGDGGTIVIECSDASGAEWFDVAINVPVRAADLSVLGGTAQTGDAYAVVTNATYGLDKLARTGADSDTLKTLSDQIDTVSASTIAAAVWAVASGSGAEDTYGNILDDLTEEAAGTYRFTTAALAQAPGGGGTLYSYSSTVDDGSNPLDGVFIQCSTNASFTNIIGTTYSNASGAYTVRSDTAGTHYLRFQLAGWNFSDETVTLA